MAAPALPRYVIRMPGKGVLLMTPRTVGEVAGPGRHGGSGAVSRAAVWITYGHGGLYVASPDWPLGRGQPGGGQLAFGDDDSGASQPGLASLQGYGELATGDGDGPIPPIVAARGGGGGSRRHRPRPAGPGL